MIVDSDSTNRWYDTPSTEQYSKLKLSLAVSVPTVLVGGRDQKIKKINFLKDQRDQEIKTTGYISHFDSASSAVKSTLSIIQITLVESVRFDHLIP